MTDINELAQRAAERFGIDGEAAVDIARTYLKQGAEAVGDDPRLIDEDDLTDEQIDTVMTAIEAEMGNAHAADEQDLATGSPCSKRSSPGSRRNATGSCAACWPTRSSPSRTSPRLPGSPARASTRSATEGADRWT